MFLSVSRIRLCFPSGIFTTNLYLYGMSIAKCVHMLFSLPTVTASTYLASYTDVLIHLNRSCNRGHRNNAARNTAYISRIEIPFLSPVVWSFALKNVYLGDESLFGRRKRKKGKKWKFQEEIKKSFE